MAVSFASAAVIRAGACVERVTSHVHVQPAQWITRLSERPRVPAFASRKVAPQLGHTIDIGGTAGSTRSNELAIEA
jgi:hypothetical protein